MCVRGGCACTAKLGRFNAAGSCIVREIETERERGEGKGGGGGGAL